MEIVLEVENLPHPQPGHTGFQCIVTIEGAKMMVPARVESNQFIVCDKTTVSFHTSITKLHDMVLPIKEYKKVLHVVKAIYCL